MAGNVSYALNVQSQAHIPSISARCAASINSKCVQFIEAKCRSSCLSPSLFVTVSASCPERLLLPTPSGRRKHERQLLLGNLTTSGPHNSRNLTNRLISCSSASAAVTAMNVIALPANAGEAWASNPAYGEVSSVLEASVQFLYLGALLALLGAGSFLVVRQVLLQRELENAAKELQERVRSGQASSEEYFELGAVMLRKKFYVMANRYLEQAIGKWDGDEQDLAQVHNALGFSYFSEGSTDKAVKQYQKAVKLQPAYVTAWNNLGDALEKLQDWSGALKAYETVLTFDPQNRVATSRQQGLQERVNRLKGIPSKSE